MVLTKESFNALELEQQVQYINEGLETQSLVKVCQAMGISEATVRDRFKSKGYTRQGNQFINTSDTVNPNTSNTTNTKATKKASKANEKPREAKSKVSNNKALEDRVTSLEKELEQLKAMILGNTSTTSNTNNTINTNNTSIVMYSSENLVSRNYKIDKEVAEQFVQFCKVQKLTNDYKVSDLATNALIQYMNKFK